MIKAVKKEKRSSNGNIQAINPPGKPALRTVHRQTPATDEAGKPPDTLPATTTTAGHLRIAAKQEQDNTGNPATTLTPLPDAAALTLLALPPERLRQLPQLAALEEEQLQQAAAHLLQWAVVVYQLLSTGAIPLQQEENRAIAA
jgi:hypothetical protein